MIKRNFQKETIWVLIYCAPKFRTVYLVKLPVLGLQWEPKILVLAPSVLVLHGFTYLHTKAGSWARLYIHALENGANLLAAANCRRYDVSSAQSLYPKSS